MLDVIFIISLVVFLFGILFISANKVAEEILSNREGENKDIHGGGDDEAGC